MSDIIASIATALIPAIVSISVAYIKYIAPLNYKNKILTQKLEEPIAVTRAFAIGYFFNFLYKIGGQSSLEVLFDQNETRINLPEDRKMKFSKNEVHIEFIVPERLSGKVFDRVVEEVPKHTARILNSELPGGFRINYDFSQRGNKSVLVIKDAVRPYFAIKYYLEDCLGRVEGSSEWQKLEKDTLKEFEDKILELATKGEGIFNNRISWKRIG